MSGPLAQSPLSGGFWRALFGGVRGEVAQPMVNDLRQGHRTLKEAYPLPYQIAQFHPAVGIPAATLDYADAADAGDSGGMMSAALSAIPVAEKAFRIGRAAPTSLRQAASVVGGQHGISLPAWMGGVYKAGAAENVTQVGEAAYDQANKLMGRTDSADRLQAPLPEVR